MRSQREHHRALAEAHRREAATLVRRAAEPARIGEHIKAQIARAAKSLGFSYSRTEDIWRMEARRIDSWEMDLMRGARAAKSTRRKRR